MAAWRAAFAKNIRDSSTEGAATRELVARLANVEQRKCHEMTGIELGYRYIDSPLICAEAGDGPDPNAKQYHPTTWPGARLPHVWLEDGSALHDRLGDGFTILRLGRTTADTTGIERPLRRLGAPVVVCEVTDGAVRQVYGRDLLLVRPDGHVVWRGDLPPSDPEALAAIATGHSRACARPVSDRLAP
jgi:hypothetical protein